MNQSVQCFEHFYTAPLWVKFKKESRCQLQVVYNDCMRILLKNKMVQSKWFILKGKSTIIPCFYEKSDV